MASMGGRSSEMSAIARSARVAPSVNVSVQSLRRSPWVMLAVVVAAGFALSAMLPHYVSGAIVNPMGAVIGIAAVGGLRRSVHTVAFNLIASGVLAYAI